MENDYLLGKRIFMTQAYSISLPKKIGFIAACVVAILGIWYYAFRSSDNIIDFEYTRDAQEIHALFKRDWYWLVAASPEEYDVDFVLRYKARRYALESIGTLTIKVLRENGEFKGFVTYYKKSPKVGLLLFLSVKDDARRKGYGEKLARYAINDLLSQGVQKIEIVTRPSNERALHLYKNKLGFKETGRDGTFVCLEYVP